MNNKTFAQRYEVWDYEGEICYGTRRSFRDAMAFAKETANAIRATVLLGDNLARTYYPNLWLVPDVGDVRVWGKKLPAPNEAYQRGPKRKRPQTKRRAQNYKC